MDNCKEGGLAGAGQEYRAELLQLPYAFADRPAITGLSSSKVGWVLGWGGGGWGGGGVPLATLSRAAAAGGTCAQPTTSSSVLHVQPCKLVCDPITTPACSSQTVPTPDFAPAGRYGGKITVSYTHTRPVTGATLIPPTATTHSTNMMQRVIFLKTSGATGGSVTVEMPPRGARVANPGHYMLWLLDGDVPVKEAAWIQLG